MAAACSVVIPTLAVLVAISVTLVAIPEVLVAISVTLVAMLVELVSVIPFNSLPWFADKALVVLVDVKLSSTNILTVVSTKFFKTFPCSADRGSMVPPEFRSSTISTILTLSLIAVVLSAKPDVFVVILELFTAISVELVLILIALFAIAPALAAISDVLVVIVVSLFFTWPSKIVSALFREVAPVIKFEDALGE